jgi:hypothetical protein
MNWNVLLLSADDRARHRDDTILLDVQRRKKYEDDNNAKRGP